MAFQGSGELEDQLEEPEDTLRVSPAEEMPVDGPPGGEEPEPPLLLPWDRFSSWLHCICVVGFDLELGQAVEVIYPHHSKLTEKEKTSICYLSFPDSNSGCLGDTQFCFRFRQASGRKSSLGCFLDHFDRDAPVSLKRDQGYYYGYVYFRQVRDKSLKRGYFQKAPFRSPKELDFPADKELKLARRINNVETSWALGATFQCIESIRKHGMC